MLSRVVRSVVPAVKRTVMAPSPAKFAVRGMAWFGPNESAPLVTEEVPVAPEGCVIPELVDTLEWVLDSPPNVHQFEEPPIIIEIEHLKNLVVQDN